MKRAHGASSFHSRREQHYRNMMLAPMVLVLGAMTRRRRARDAGAADDAGTPGPDAAGEGVPIPWFVLGFVGMVVVASTGTLPAPVLDPIAVATRFLLAMALAAMGLETDLRKLAAMGVRPLILGASSWLFITVFGLILVMLPIAY